MVLLSESLVSQAEDLTAAGNSVADLSACDGWSPRRTVEVTNLAESLVAAASV